MRYLFDAINDVKKLLDNVDHIPLLLDYDGTIAPIVERPELAILSEETRELLRGISGLSKYTLCIVSGRPLDDVKKLVGIEGIYYIGNHGLEAEGSDINYVNPDAIKTKPIIDELHQKFTNELKHIKGILLEHKNITVTVHYRMVSDNDVSEVKGIFSRIVQPYLEKGNIKIAENKKTLEILPNVKWDKGKMILQILDLLSSNTILKNVLPIYIGDDTTDEDAFNALGNNGISILVSEQIRESYAQYYVKDVDEVIKFLKSLKKI